MSDLHTIFIKCPKSSTNEEIVDVFRISLDNYISENNTKIDCDFYVNIISNNEDISFGLAFVYLTNTEVYNMLFGLNRDGSERYEMIDDPEWFDPPRSRSNSTSESLKLSEEKKNSLNNTNSLMKLNWTTLMDAEEEYENLVMEKKNKHICPKIKIKLDPLFVLIDLEFNNFEIQSAMPSKVKEGYKTNIIKSSKIPNMINEIDIKNLFIPYTSDVTTVQFH